MVAPGAGVRADGAVTGKKKGARRVADALELQPHAKPRGLELEPQAPLDRSSGAQREDASARADRVGSVPVAVDAVSEGTVDRAGASVESAAQRVARGVPVAEIEDVEEAHAGSNRKPLANLLVPAELRVNRLQPTR